MVFAAPYFISDADGKLGIACQTYFDSKGLFTADYRGVALG